MVSPSRRAMPARPGLRDRTTARSYPCSRSTRPVNSPIGPAPMTHHRLARGHRRLGHRPDGDGERLDERPGAIVDIVGEREQHALVDDDLLGVAAGSSGAQADAVRYGVGADLLVAAATDGAFSALAEGQDADACAHRPATTPSPTARIRPDSSCPGTVPAGNSAGTSRKCRSDPQIPQCATSISAWPGPGLGRRRRRLELPV